MTKNPGVPAEVVILHGVQESLPQPDDADTLVQAAAIADALQAAGCATRELALGLDLSVLQHLQPRAAAPQAAVFNLVESLAGRGALLHLPVAVLETFGIPFTGSGSMALALTTDKPRCKELLRAAGVRTPDWWSQGSLPVEQRVIVKPSREDGSCGITAASVMNGAEAVACINATAADAPDAVFAEAFVDGREFNVSLLDAGDGLQVLPVAEIRFVDFPSDRPRILDYEAKWAPESAVYRGTQRHTLRQGEEASLTGQLASMAQRIWSVFGLRGYARVDFRVDDRGTPWVVDVNANPCLSPDAGFAAAAESAGIAFPQLVQRIASAAVLNNHMLNIHKVR